MGSEKRPNEEPEAALEKPDGDVPSETLPETLGPVLYYTETLIEHFTNPRNVGEMDAEEADGYALSGDPLCGDQMKLWIQVEEGRIAEIKFKSFGCPGAIATSSMVTELARGSRLEEALALTDDDVIEALGGIPENKKHCSLQGITALQAAIADHLRRSERFCARKATEPT
jgi:nitrogen fixation NifU-like protein